jgi:hypothetical protein
MIAVLAEDTSCQKRNMASVRPSENRDFGALPLTSDNAFRSTGALFRASFRLSVYIEFAYIIMLIGITLNEAA